MNPNFFDLTVLFAHLNADFTAEGLQCQTDHQVRVELRSALRRHAVAVTFYVNKLTSIHTAPIDFTCLKNEIYVF